MSIPPVDIFDRADYRHFRMALALFSSLCRSSDYDKHHPAGIILQAPPDEEVQLRGSLAAERLAAIVKGIADLTWR